MPLLNPPGSLPLGKPKKVGGPALLRTGSSPVALFPKVLPELVVVPDGVFEPNNVEELPPIPKPAGLIGAGWPKRPLIAGFVALEISADTPGLEVLLDPKGDGVGVVDCDAEVDGRFSKLSSKLGFIVDSEDVGGLLLKSIKGRLPGDLVVNPLKMLSTGGDLTDSDDFCAVTAGLGGGRVTIWKIH